MEPLHSSHGQTVRLRVNDIIPNPNNPRKNLGDITDLANSISQQGIRQNLLVTPTTDGKYMLVIGHRRFAAAQQVGLTEVPCVVDELTDRQQQELMLVENSQRSSLTLLEEANGYQGLLDLGETIEEAANLTGHSASYVRRRQKVARTAHVTSMDISSLTLDQLMIVSKYDDDPQTVDRLIKAAYTGDFDITVRQVEDDRRVVKNKPLILAALKANDIPVDLDENTDYWNYPYFTRIYLSDDNCGKQLNTLIEGVFTSYGIDTVHVRFEDDNIFIVCGEKPHHSLSQEESEYRKKLREHNRKVSKFAKLSQENRLEFMRKHLKTIRPGSLPNLQFFLRMAEPYFINHIFDTDTTSYPSYFNSFGSFDSKHVGVILAALGYEDAPGLGNKLDSMTLRIITIYALYESNMISVWDRKSNIKNIAQPLYTAMQEIGYQISHDEQDALNGKYTKQEI